MAAGTAAGGTTGTVGRLVAALTVLVGGVAACGGDSSSTTTTEATSTTAGDTTTTLDQAADSACLDLPEPADAGDPAPGSFHVVLACPAPTGAVPRAAEREGGVPDGQLGVALVREVLGGPTDDERRQDLTTAWEGELDATVTTSGDEVVIDLDPAVVDEVVSAPAASSSFFIPLVGSALLDDSVGAVRFLVGGDEERFVLWWQATDAVFTRDEWDRFDRGQ